MKYARTNIFFYSRFLYISGRNEVQDSEPQIKLLDSRTSQNEKGTKYLGAASSRLFLRFFAFILKLSNMYVVYEQMSDDDEMQAKNVLSNF